MTHKAHKLRSGVYMYRGYKITKHPSDTLLPGERWIWEVEDPNGDVFIHAPTLRLSKAFIDEEEDKLLQLRKDLVTPEK